ncbi:FAD-binding domain-containing protein [uncultured Algimonas sp.]|uniref:FAD-binding domain-containing protein n=1 Tax=uncultured Algimonas sp. TaxID=1547920 RepID=UPI0026225111|nr:FAD-binding domain-containing protein [uncultured Algimonas sp.]
MASTETDRQGASVLSACADRRDLAVLARALSPHLGADDQLVSPTQGGREAAMDRMASIDPVAYARTRNHLDGAVTLLGPYIRHGVVALPDVRDTALATVGHPTDAEKLVQQLAWRDYWRRLYGDYGMRIWDDLEDYKTGFGPEDYADTLPDDIKAGATGVAAIDAFVEELVTTGCLHNHARLYLAAYVCHFRRVKWQAGARFFLRHLLDGDPASNNLSWQWVASTFSNKPYYFNLENLQRFADGVVDTRYEHNVVLAGSYEDLHLRLFPNLDPPEPRKPARPRRGSRR